MRLVPGHLEKRWPTAQSVLPEPLPEPPTRGEGAIRAVLAGAGTLGELK